MPTEEIGGGDIIPRIDLKVDQLQVGIASVLCGDFLTISIENPPT
jgi:hypothetical protein